MSASAITSLPNLFISASELTYFASNSSWSTTAKVISLKVASYLTEPVCKVREYFYTFYILNTTCKNTAEKILTAVFLTCGIFSFSLLTPFTAPIGVMIRGIVATVESKPYIYLEKTDKGKVLPTDGTISIVSHNECYMPAGYCITDGQVTPPSDKNRFNANIQKIKELDPDIVCLYEVPDICDAESISSQLSDYPFVIPVSGVRAIGPSSGMYVASKYPIAKESIEFIPFIKGTELTGRAKYAEKGFLSFDITSKGIPFATIISTHLQHSEIPASPEEMDKTSRSLQMDKIAKKIKDKIDHQGTVIFTGDLNQEEPELDTFLKSRQIDWLRRDPSVQGKATWGGDQWCAELMKKPPSGPLVLDYTFIAGKASSISTKVLDVGYSGSEFRPEATSDHHLLFSTVTLEKASP